MIFRFPCMRTDKVGLARSMRAARIFMQAFYPRETITEIKYNVINMAMDVYTSCESSKVLWVKPKEIMDDGPHIKCGLNI